jgi:hypothetical protein
MTVLSPRPRNAPGAMVPPTPTRRNPVGTAIVYFIGLAIFTAGVLGRG